MNAETESLVLEHLRATRADVGAVRDDCARPPPPRLVHGTASGEHPERYREHPATDSTPMATASGRIERGLELADAPA